MVAPNVSDLIDEIYENSEHKGRIELGNINARHLTADLPCFFESQKLGQRHCEPCDIRNGENWDEQFRFEENITWGV